MRAGLEALARAHPQVSVLGSVALGSELRRKAIELDPDVIVAEVERQAAEVLADLPGFPVVLLADENALPLLRSGARAVLPHGASASEIGLAIEAAAAGCLLPAGRTTVPPPRLPA